MKKKYRSRIAKNVHQTVEGLYKIGVADLATMRDFDKSCLTSTPPLRADDVKEIREREKASQAVLANYLGVTTETVGKWERGERKIQGAALKLLSLVKENGLDYIA